MPGASAGRRNGGRAEADGMGREREGLAGGAGEGNMESARGQRRRAGGGDWGRGIWGSVEDLPERGGGSYRRPSGEN